MIFYYHEYAIFYGLYTFIPNWIIPIILHTTYNFVYGSIAPYISYSSFLTIVRFTYDFE